MTCHPFKAPGLGTGFVCTSGRSRRCVGCGRRATLLCDWKVPARKSGTCDKPICLSCSTSPEPGKDLCPEHSGAFQRWKQERAAREARP